MSLIFFYNHWKKTNKSKYRVTMNPGSNSRIIRKNKAMKQKYGTCQLCAQKRPKSGFSGITKVVLKNKKHFYFFFNPCHHITFRKNLMSRWNFWTFSFSHQNVPFEQNLKFFEYPKNYVKPLFNACHQTQFRKTYLEKTLKSWFWAQKRSISPILGIITILLKNLSNHF